MFELQCVSECKLRQATALITLRGFYCPTQCCNDAEVRRAENIHTEIGEQADVTVTINIY